MRFLGAGGKMGFGGKPDHVLLCGLNYNFGGIYGSAYGQTLVVYDENTEKFSRLHNLLLSYLTFHFDYTNMTDYPYEVDENWLYLTNVYELKQYVEDGSPPETLIAPAPNQRKIVRISTDESQGLTYGDLGLVTGTNSYLGTVIAIEKGTSGDLYVAGSFDTISNTTNTKRIARWNNTAGSWEALSTGIGVLDSISTTNYVTSIAFSANDSIYAAYQKSGSNTEIFKYNGSNWSSIGTSSSGSPVLLEMDENDDLVAVGSFTSVNGVTATRVAVYDTSGATWTAPYEPGFNNTVYQIYKGPTGQDMYFTGSFTSVQGVTTTYATRKPAGTTAWVELGNGFGSTIRNTKATESGKFFAADTVSVTLTNFRYRNIDGSDSFTNRSKYAPSRIGGESGLANRYTLKSFGSKIYMSVSAGYFQFGFDRNNYNTEGFVLKRMDRDEFNASDSFLGTYCNFAIDDYQGTKTLYGNFDSGDLYKWNPSTSSWSLFLDTNGDIHDMKRVGSDLYFTGRGTFLNMANRITRWDGSSFNQLGTGLNSFGWALETDGTDLFVGGQFTTAGGVTVNRVAKWNGSSWSAMNTGTVGMNNTIYSLLWDEVDSKLYAAGAFTTAGGVSANRVAVWDPSTSTWSALGTGLNNTAFDMALDSENRRLYISGNFTSAGGDTSKQIVTCWNINTSSYESLGFVRDSSPLNEAGRWLHWDSRRKRLYLSGGYRCITSENFRMDGIGYWDGTKWNPVKYPYKNSFDENGATRVPSRPLTFEIGDIESFEQL